MLNYIKSEIYRNLRSKGNYIFLFGCMIFVIFLNVVLSMFVKSDPNFPYASTKYSFSALYTSMVIPLILCLLIGSIVLGEEFKNHTLKNSISYGISRNQIYFGKYVILLIVSAINLIFISASFIISGFLLLENSGPLYFNELIRALIACTPLFLVSITLVQCLYFVFQSDTRVVVLWVIIMIVIPKVFSMLGARVELFRKIATWTPYNIVGNITQGEGAHNLVMYWCSQQGMINCFITGIIGTTLFYIIGMQLFKKVEIK